MWFVCANAQRWMETLCHHRPWSSQTIWCDWVFGCLYWESFFFSFFLWGIWFSSIWIWICPQIGTDILLYLWIVVSVVNAKQYSSLFFLGGGWIAPLFYFSRILNRTWNECMWKINNLKYDNLSIAPHIYIYIYIYVCVCVCVYW